jgi:ATP-dependent helicase/nuclease subunit B
MVEEAAFEKLGARTVRAAQFIGLGSTPKAEDAPIADEPSTKILAELVGLLSAYLEGDKGYASRRAMENDSDSRDYDQLARYGEWDVTADAVPEVLE